MNFIKKNLKFILAAIVLVVVAFFGFNQSNLQGEDATGSLFRRRTPVRINQNLNAIQAVNFPERYEQGTNILNFKFQKPLAKKTKIDFSFDRDDVQGKSSLILKPGTKDFTYKFIVSSNFTDDLSLKVNVRDKNILFKNGKNTQKFDFGANIYLTISEQNPLEELSADIDADLDIEISENEEEEQDPRFVIELEDSESNQEEENQEEDQMSEWAIVDNLNQPPYSFTLAGRESELNNERPYPEESLRIVNDLFVRLYRENSSAEIKTINLLFELAEVNIDTNDTRSIEVSNLFDDSEMDYTVTPIENDSESISKFILSIEVNENDTIDNQYLDFKVEFEIDQLSPEGTSFVRVTNHEVIYSEENQEKIFNFNLRNNRRYQRSFIYEY